MGVELSLQRLQANLKTSTRMPLVFLGHGSPMNAIEDTAFSRSWTELGRILPRPQAILVVSAHWMTRGTTLVDVSPRPRIIHDFYGFPDALYAQQYPAQGDPELAAEVVTLLAEHRAQGDNSWGLDHGAWTLLKFLYPAADVPVFQLSVDLSKPLRWHLDLGKTLSSLRDRGVLILGSGNLVHNLSALRYDGNPHDWALEFDHQVAERLIGRDFNALSDQGSSVPRANKETGDLMRLAHPTLEHYIPALTIAGASRAKDELYFTTEGISLGSLSMRSFVFHGS